MGLLKFFSRAARIRKRLTTRRISIAITSKRTVSQSNDAALVPVAESQKVHSAKDVERIQSLPSVTVVHVIDGDTVIVASASSQVKVRLDSIDCPEKGQQWGDIATRGLIKLIGGKSVKLEVHGSDVHDRMLGTLFLYLKDKGKWQNVNERMVTLGHAWVMRLKYGHLPPSRRQKLNQLERWAKSKSVGLWKTANPTAPWKWRKR